MADDDPHFLGDAVWEMFLDQHHFTIEEEDAFLEYLTRPNAPRLESLSALEAAYQQFLTQRQDAHG